MRPMHADSDIIADYTRLVGQLSNEEARYYLRFGFIPRALQIKEARFQLLQVMEKSGGSALDVYHTTSLNMYLNSLYFNMCGAMDNLAWGMQHEASVVDDLGKDKRDVGLFARKFKQGLKNIDSSVAKTLGDCTEWGREMKEFRDPIAHRIPLYISRCVITTESQKEEYRAYERNLGETDYSEDPNAYMEAFRNMLQVGTFKAVFLGVYSSGQIKQYPLTRTVKCDYQAFWKIAEIVLGFLAKKSADT